MCGILVQYAMGKFDVCDEKANSHGLAILSHRGPDSQNYWLSRDRRVYLGHARLSIIDLSTGGQPISSDTTHIVANGEFYDFERIRGELIGQGYRFKTRSDSEIALHLYDRQGTSCLQHLRGEFAFSVWDSDNQILFSARDRFGIKPLFYTVHNNSLYLASEMKALFAAGIPAIWDTDSYLSRAFVFRDRTLFQGIHQVPPGCFLLATRGGIRIQRYWDFDYPLVGCTDQRRDEDIVADVRATLLDAVQTRLRADVPVGVYLSGGVDSCSLLGMASTLRDKPLDAFTLSFVEDAAYDEGALAEEMATKAGANFHLIPVRQSDLADNFSDAIWHNEVPCLNPHLVAKFLLSKAVRDFGCPVVLTGEGADEIAGGYVPFRRDMVLYNSEGQDRDNVAKLLTMLEQSNKIASGTLLPVSEPLGLEFLERILGFKPSWLLPQAEIIAKVQRLFSRGMTEQLGKLHPFHQFLNHLDVVNQVQGRDPVHVSMYLLAKSVLPNYVLTTLGDRMEMAHSIESRLPFLDHLVVEKIVNLPVSLKIKNMTEKWILREAARPYLLESVYRREKHPFLAPPSSLARGGKLYQHVQDMLRGPVLNNLPFFNQTKVKEFLDSIPSLAPHVQTSAEPVLMELLSMCILQQRFQVGTEGEI
ncbi:MAG: asparagine synthase (glutamine-hydrolyzing) [Desulfobulbaceae bacterium]|nr:asparagine synthase (glutamine-hydrolyzing) [Desulfobulbaceae bacterium]